MAAVPQGVQMHVEFRGSTAADRQIWKCFFNRLLHLPTAAEPRWR
jgi:hypothetical protein